MRLLNLKSQMDTIGPDRFDRNFKGVEIKGQHDSHNRNNNSRDAGFDVRGTYVEIGSPEAKGSEGFKPALTGRKEYTRYTGAEGQHKLTPGEWRYMEKPGDNKSDTQGWNTIYVGQNEKGEHQFWRVGQKSGGIHSVEIDSKGNPNDSEGNHSTIFEGDYLSTMVGLPPWQEQSQLN